MPQQARLLTVAAAFTAFTAIAAGTSATTSKPASAAVQTVADAAAGDPANGKKLFAANCAGCHGATGTEGGVGPSLKDEKSRKDMAATVAWIKDPKAPMPKLYPSPLSEKDVNDVAAYVEKL